MTPAPTDAKQCVHCGSYILAVAIKCRYCKHFQPEPLSFGDAEAGHADAPLDPLQWAPPGANEFGEPTSWVCPECGVENDDTGLAAGMQVCGACGVDVEVNHERLEHWIRVVDTTTGADEWIPVPDADEDPDEAQVDQTVAHSPKQESNWGAIMVALLVVGAGWAYLGGYFEEDATGGPLVGQWQPNPRFSATFTDFDARVAECVQNGPEPVQDTTRTYKWRYDNREWTYTSTYSSAVHNCLAHPDIRDDYARFDYAQYVQARFDDQAIAGMVEKFREVATTRGYSDREVAEFLLAFVQSLTYATDDVTTPYDEWPRFPMETLYVQGGDCEDTAILYAALIQAMGYSPVLLAPTGHMAAGIPVQRTTEGGVEYQDRFYAYVETTNTGWNIGELPPAYADADVQVYPLW